MRKYKPIIFSFLFSVLATLLLAAIAGFIINKFGTLPTDAMPFIVLGIACAAVLLGAYFGAGVIRENGIVIGLSIGCGYVVLSMLISFTMGMLHFTPAGIGRCCCILLCSAIGGILGVNRKTKTKF